MKCLVLLVLVAVCQGVVLRDSPRSQWVRQQRIQKYISKLEQSPEHSKLHVGLDQIKRRVPLDKTIQMLQDQRENREHKKQYPMEESTLGQKLQQSFLNTPIETIKQSGKSPFQPLSQNTPFTQYSRPQAFLDYIKTFNEPWNPVTTVYPDVLDFKTFGDLMKFPGGDFLQNEIDKCLWIMTKDERVSMYWPAEEFEGNKEIDLTEVQGVRDVLPYIATKLEKMVPLYMQTTSDPSTMAMLVTRDLIKIVLHGRMKCSTTTSDKYFIQNVNDQLNKITNDEKYQLLENFKTLLPEIVPEVSDIIEQLVYTITQDVQLHVYKDVMQYAHGVAFRDVAIVAHKLYHDLKSVFEDSRQQDVPTSMEQLVTVVTEVVANYGTCPIGENVHIKELACWDFDKLFLERELAYIHSRVMNIVHHFLYRTCTGEDCMQYYPRVTEVFKTIIRRYISTIVQRVPMCQTPCRDPMECLVNGYPFQGSSRMERLWTTIPFWNSLWNKVDQVDMFLI